MATLYLRDFPDDLYEKVRALAAEERRSLRAELITLIDQAATTRTTKAHSLAVLEAIGVRRKSLKLIPGGEDSLSMLREDREQ